MLRLSGYWGIIRNKKIISYLHYKFNITSGYIQTLEQELEK